MKRDQSSRARLMAAVTGLLSLTLLAGACEGDNLFEGGVGEEAPQITTLSVPSGVDSGEAFEILVIGTAPRGVRFIEVRVSGAATDSIREEFSGSSMTESLSVTAIPSAGIGSQVVVDAYVQDANGRKSSTRRATVPVNSTTSGSAGG